MPRNPKGEWPGDGAPKVSVIIATYNYSSVLRYAIATVLWQTFQDFELIVVGDCCTDDSEEVVRSFRDQRIRWLNLSENSGAKYIPQNAGIALARGPYIAYLAHDDLWHPEHLATLVDAIEREKADVAYSVLIYVPPPGDSQRHVSGIFPEPVFSPGYCLIHSSAVHRKKLIEEIGEWDDHRKTQLPPDHIFWSRVAEAGKRFVAVPKVTVWKFNASSRPGSYREKRSDEQARYFAMIRDDPALAEKELIDVVRSAMRFGLEPQKMQKIGRDAPPGSYVHFLRQVRGLEPVEPMQPLDLEAGNAPFRVNFAEQLASHLTTGEKTEIEVRIENGSAFQLSSQAPHPVHFSYHWLNANDNSMVVFDGLRSQLLPPLAAQSSLHYFVRIEAPPTSGLYRLQPALVQEEVCWFHNVGRDPLPEIEVRPPTTPGM